MYKIAVFVSGRGSNLKAILNSQNSLLSGVEVAAVVSNKPDCPALELARGHGITTLVVNSNKHESGRVTYFELISLFEKKGVDLIVLAGFLKKIPDEFVTAYENRVINIHPALLPSFGGRGMYGMNVHRAVFEKSVQISGATVHFVNTVYDDGIIIAQRATDVSEVESPEDVAAKVLEVEHELLPYVIKKFSEDKVVVKNNRGYILD